MEQDSIAAQLWTYIDGDGTTAEREQIANQIAGNELWRKMYEELKETELLLAVPEPEQPSMRFTRNVMDVVSASHISAPATRYINMAVVKGIAAFFGISIGLLLAFTLLTVEWGPASSALLPKITMPSIRLHIPASWNSQAVYFVGLANVVLLLLFIDASLKRKRRTAVK